MSIDPYTPCPGGKDKKVKFCCPDLLGELEKIQRMVDGDQRLGCVEYIEQLEAKYPDRACLLTTKAMLLSGMGRTDEAQAALAKVLVDSPLNPVALAEQALVVTQREGAIAGVAALQKAIAASPSPMPAQIYEAIVVVGQSLMLEGRILPARGHLMFAVGLAPQDEQVLQLLVQLNTSPMVPLLLKSDPDFAPAPEGAAWKGEFEAAMEPTWRGAWQASADKLSALAAKTPDAPAIWKNLALLRGWLADTPGTVAALRRLATLEVPLDDAVDAEATAQLIDADAPRDRIDVLQVVYPIADVDRLTELLASDNRADRVVVDPTGWTDQGQPPPRNAFVVLDRPLPATGAGIKAADAPRILGQVLIFGRQTDREARLELKVERPDLAAIQTVLNDIARDALKPAEGDAEVVGDVPALQRVLSWNSRLPVDTPADLVHALVAEQRRRAIVEDWPNYPQQRYGGRSLAEAAADPALRTAVLAEILILELTHDTSEAEETFAELRRRLNLPQPAPIDPAVVSIDHVPLARLARVDLTKLNDDDLKATYRRAVFSSARQALRRLIREFLARPTLADVFGKTKLYGSLAKLEDDTRAALALVDQARDVAEATGESSVAWDLEELGLRIERGEIQEIDRLVRHIQSAHGREPGVARALMQVLVESGLVRPDGRPAGPPPAEAPGIVVPGAASEAGKLWTPDSESAGGKKSALWTPGMD